MAYSGLARRDLRNAFKAGRAGGVPVRIRTTGKPDLTQKMR